MTWVLVALVVMVFYPLAALTFLWLAGLVMRMLDADS